MSDEANRHFETSAEARAWLIRMCDAIRSEISLAPKRFGKWQPLHFLCADYGMELLVDRESEARFVRDALEVVVCAQPFEVYLMVGLRASEQGSYSWFTPQELCPGTERIAGGFMYHDPAQIPHLLTLMGSALRGGCDAVLKGSVQEFEQAAQRNSESFQRWQQKEDRRRAAEVAEAAWRRRDYATVFAAYAPVSKLLSRAETRKLEYACKKLGDGTSALSGLK